MFRGHDFLTHLNVAPVAPSDHSRAVVGPAAGHARLRGGSDGRSVLVVDDVDNLINSYFIENSQFLLRKESNKS